MPSQRTPPRPPGDRPDRARRALLLLFGLLGFMLSAWLARFPSLRDALDLSPSRLGVVLLIGAVGSLLTTLVSGFVTTRWGGLVALRVSAVGWAVAYSLGGVAALTGSVALFIAAVVLQGSAFAVANVTINVESAGIERRAGRSLVPQFHAMFSVGAVLGAGFGAIASLLGVPVAAQFAASAVVGLVVQLAVTRTVVVDTRVPAPETVPAADGGAEPRGAESRSPEPSRRPVRGTTARSARQAAAAWTERRTILLGVVVFAAALSEGSANQWLSLAVVDGFAAAEAVGASLLGVFVVSMTVVRSLGTRLLDRYGRVVVLRTSGVIALVGLLLFVYGPSLLVAGAGVAAWGVGAALAFPIALAAASDDPVRAAVRVSVVTSFAAVARISAPPLLGLLGESVGIRHALVVIAAGLVLSILLAGEAAPPKSRVGIEPQPPSSDPTAVPEPGPVAAPAPEPGAQPEPRNVPADHSALVSSR